MNNGFCLASTPYPVFVAQGTTQNDISKQLFAVLNISETSFGRDLPERAKLLPPLCLSAYRTLVCSKYVPGINSPNIHL